MSQRPTLVDQLKVLSRKSDWTIEQVTTPTGLVVGIEQQAVDGIWWDLTDVTLDTTIATMTLIRTNINGPITVFTPKVTERILHKLYRAKVDDIITLPFSLQVIRPQLEQRLWVYHHSHLRKPTPDNPKPSGIINTGDWQINQHNYTVTKNDQVIALTPKEFQLLSYLVAHRGQVLSRDQLVTGVWGYDLLDTSRIVDIHISHLRDKLEDDSQHPTHLLTIRGFGYKLV